MSKKIITIIIAIIVVVGLGYWIYQSTSIREEGTKIETKSGDNFSVVLEANPTTGYQWELDFDSDYIQLVDRKYIPRSPELIGSGGEETFNFLALKSGETEITFSYLRVWEEKEPIEKKFYEIVIK